VTEQESADESALCNPLRLVLKMELGAPGQSQTLPKLDTQTTVFFGRTHSESWPRERGGVLQESSSLHTAHAELTDYLRLVCELLKGKPKLGPRCMSDLRLRVSDILCQAKWRIPLPCVP